MVAPYSNLIKGVEYIFISVDALRHFYITSTVRKLCGPIQNTIKMPDFPLTHLVKGRTHTSPSKLSVSVPVFLFH